MYYVGDPFCLPTAAGMAGNCAAETCSNGIASSRYGRPSDFEGASGCGGDEVAGAVEEEDAEDAEDVVVMVGVVGVVAVNIVTF